MKKNPKLILTPETLLLSREIFKNKATQVVISGLLLATLGIQVYLFVTINQILRTLIQTTGF
ncbi:hypothetical protein K9M59_03995 [Candidatus Gracilibacteria bacterium]|nr:hypothetical protein [Candidatus Gracilibacteria bacterium]MCF7819485.1 hypothetical protein [Candidatus Gracilibacteria bacterium]